MIAITPLMVDAAAANTTTITTTMTITTTTATFHSLFHWQPAEYHIKYILGVLMHHITSTSGSVLTTSAIVYSSATVTT